MIKVLTHFQHSVEFACRPNNTLNLAYCNITQAYRAAPHLGSSDHLSVKLILAYKALLIRKGPTGGQVRVCEEGTEEVLLDCFKHRDWDMFREAAKVN